MHLPGNGQPSRKRYPFFRRAASLDKRRLPRTQRKQKAVNIRQLRAYVEETKSLAFLAMGVIPAGSYYYKWCKQLTADELEARKFAKLRERLVKFHAQ